MLKKTVTYTDYEGNERTEDFYFNFNQAELTKMEVSTPGGMKAQLERLIAAQDGATIMQIFENIITGSYGEKSPDGKRFIKSKELSTAFLQTEAYNQIFMELVLDPSNAGAKFINGIIPQQPNPPPTPK